jgi:glycosyltransferase involved in cell wall biosynthesis
VIEAQLAARPVVAAAHGGLLEMVEEETDGWLVEPGEVDAWAGALRRLAQSADALGHMGRRARERAQRVHDYEGFLDRHEEIYSGLAGVAP